jgi:hypothetical protein
MKVSRSCHAGILSSKPPISIGGCPGQIHLVADEVMLKKVVISDPRLSDEFRIDRIEPFVSDWKAQEASPNSLSCLFSESVMTDGIISRVTRSQALSWPASPST